MKTSNTQINQTQSLYNFTNFYAVRIGITEVTWGQFLF